MKILKNAILLLVVSLIINGCLVKHEIVFNEDFSGTYYFTLDFSQLSGMMTDSTGNSQNTMNSNFDTIVNNLKVIPGISNIRINDNPNGGKLEIIYDFRDVEALNTSIKSSSQSGENMPNKSNPILFKLKKNTLSMKQKATKFEKDSASATLNEMFQYEFSVVFKKDIRKAHLNNGAVQSDKSISLKGKYFDTLGKNTSWKIKF
ncbi:MAG: hypothetical protein A2W91_03160 [Bacteroidetes bacterium GWF2_38_335]|nr:MAG: hypothetical protein A2W91_03160 [Bacteroidetes bacterium GWF2_38_335]OFY77511.1 MAG: hypothetical protein A2281_01600 [Bacteroidetes bacterium RIFOXYA12_FULL_38_20]HBS87193.1 hypothetical protein [Bacteroidales bacterium]